MLVVLAYNLRLGCEFLLLQREKKPTTKAPWRLFSNRLDFSSLGAVNSCEACPDPGSRSLESVVLRDGQAFTMLICMK